MIERQNHIQTKGGRIFAKSWEPIGESGQATIVLIHDSLGCVGLWRKFPAELAERTGRRVIAYDRLGFGQSDAREDVPSPRFVQEEWQTLAVLLDSIEIERAVLFGYSVGGSMALCASAQMPDRVTAVISESAQAFMEDRTLEGLRAARRLFSQPDQLDRLRKWHGEKTGWILSAWLDLWMSPAFAHWSLADILPKVRCPVLTIHGDLDDYGSVAFPNMIADLSAGPATKLILEGCRHVPHRERLDDVLAAVERFLSQIGEDYGHDG